ncbi:MAG: TadE/TadG family type IV pilus assembly protein, partial [Kineosporiaceae bacterium]
MRAPAVQAPRGAGGAVVHGSLRMLARRLGDPERGAFLIEAVWLMPVLVLVLFAGIQYAWWYDAGATCQGAAAAGAAAAAAMS